MILDVGPTEFIAVAPLGKQRDAGKNRSHIIFKPCPGMQKVSSSIKLAHHDQQRR